MALLEVHDITAGFGSNQVLHGVSLAVEPGEIAGIFGLNGAGKSVTMKAVAGLVPVWSGRVVFDGTDVTRLSPEERVALGIGNVPQGRQVFPELTVEENLRLGAYTTRRRDRSVWPARLAAAFDRFPVLATRRNDLAGTLSGGQQASLAVARALVNEPTLLLIDEPSAGLAPIVIAELFQTLKDVAATGMTMVLVEQNVTFGLQLVERAHLLQTGRVVHTAPVAELDQDTLARHLGIGRMLAPRVKKAPARKKAAPRKAAPAKKAPTKKAAPAKKAPTKKAAPAKKAASKKAVKTAVKPVKKAGRR